MVLLGGLAAHFFVALLEAVDTTCGVHDFLLARVERMASCTNVSTKRSACGASLYDIAASTANVTNGIFGVDAKTHRMISE
jgi:hypothetical protein